MKDDRAAPHVALVPDVKRFKSFHLITPDGRGLSSGEAAVATLAAVRRTAWLGRAFDGLHLAWLAGAFYQLLVRSKKFLGRFVADIPGPDRYP